MTPDPRGLLLCSQYAFAPNSLHYCGPEKQLDLASYLEHQTPDQGLVEILDKFDTLYKYLILIASHNNIPDPFDMRVVEAYWVGNNLLNNVSKYVLGNFLTDSIQLKKKVPHHKLHPMIDAVVDGGLPHHTVHVLNIFNRTGHHAVAHTLDTMDNCRISWGRVTTNVIRNKTNNILVRTQLLEYKNNRLLLGAHVTKSVALIHGHLNEGDWVSLHWGCVCQKITHRQKLNLEYYTNLALTQANNLHVFA